MSTPEQPIVDGSRMAWGRPSQQLTRSANGTTTASSIPDRSYVATTGNGNALFLIENGRRQRIYPNDVERLQITQNDILQVDPLALSYFPPAGTGQRAIGRNLQFYHPSDLHSGHDMQSWAWLEGTTLTTRTVTRTHTWFGGYTGGVQFVLYDVNGRRIQHNEIRYRYGVDGRAFGSGTQDKPESEQLPQIVADAANTILITHYWDPKVDLVAAAIQTAEFVWEVIQTIWDWYQQGQNVNAGSESFE